MDLDTVEQRYLITAAADSTIEAFDVLVSWAGLAEPVFYNDCHPLQLAATWLHMCLPDSTECYEVVPISANY